MLFLKNIIFNKNFIKYIAIGFLNTLVGFGLIFSLMALGFSPEISNVIGYFIGFMVSFSLNKKYNFRSNKSIGYELPRFLFAMLIAYLINFIILILLFRIFNLNKYLSQIIAASFYVLLGYNLSKYWVFKK